ncbi:arylsulfatase [Flavivirga aquimarina]|uniref:Arylsulfatase n=1 Tax=Flavivirga aquimarina TaxID=2027862 RepID=A0ABT8WDX3_9FLAO|nr:arylsulfatase [Flavivirga aquimarina]MDO5971330.1 arylsulfatase [Flavivirga aquimarina]
MKKTNLKVIVALCFVFFSCKEEHKTTVSNVDTKKPNVIIIMTDDQGYGDLSCHGNPYVKTPIIDEFYRKSIRFTDFHVDPSCSPTRSALLTGNYSARAGVWHTIGGRSLLKEGMVTMPELFKDNGYETAVFGKWHLGENYPFRPIDRGFKEAIVHGGGGIGQNPDYWGNNYDDDTYKHKGVFKKYDGYCNTVWFGEAINYIKKNKDKPFFCYISTNLPHAPLLVDEKYIEPYKKQVSGRLASYYGMISKIDEDIGVLFKEVKNMGLEENTIVIFMTDNGPCPWFGGIVIDFETGLVKEGYSSGMRGGKIWGYENAQHVPFFIRWPKGNIKGGKDIDVLTAHIDVMPTLIDLCKLNIDDTLKIDGRNLTPLLDGSNKEWLDDRTLFIHNQRVEYPVKDKEYQVLTEQWRLVKRETDELYNIKTDPEQKTNVVKQHPNIVKDLYHRYENWWEDVSVDFDKYAKIYIGTPYENPVSLYAHDAHTRNGKKIWVVNVARDGKYEVNLNRWPQESEKRIVENRRGDQEVDIENVHLNVGNIYKTATVTNDMKTVKFELNLKAGTTCFETYFKLKGSSKTFSTECIYVNYIGKGEEPKIKDYVASVPDRLLKDNYKQKVILFD